MSKLKRKIDEQTPKKDEFGPKEFCEMLKDPALTVKGLQKFCQVNQRYTRNTKLEDIVKGYIQRSSECLEIFNCIESGKTTPHYVSCVFEALVQILLRTGNDLSKESSEVGTSITRRLLQGHLREIYRGLSLKNSAKVIIPTLRLLTAMVVQGSECAYDVATSLELNGKVITTLAKYQADNSNAMSKTLRQCFVRFVLSFFVSDGEAKTKHVLQHIIDAKGFVDSVFHHLTSDTAATINLLLTTIKEKAVLNPTFSKPNRVKLLGSHKVLHKISCLFQWDGTMDVDLPDGKASIHKLAFDFLQEICCSFKNGINFLDKELGTGVRCGNFILLQFLLDLEQSASNQHAHQLVVEILKVCPDLLLEYFNKSPLSFDPRPTPVWFENMKLLRAVYSSQPDLPCAVMRAAKQQGVTHDDDKLVAMTMPALLPSAFKRSSLKVALQSPKSAVVLEAIYLVTTSLEKLQTSLEFLKDEEVWRKSVYSKEDRDRFAKLLSATLSKFLPDVASIVKNWTSKLGDLELEEGFLKLLSMYQGALPDSFERCIYNFSNLLQHEDILTDKFNANNIIYILKILSQNPYKYKWFKKESSKHTLFYQLIRIMLRHYNGSGGDEIIQHSMALLEKIATSNNITTEGSSELYVWVGGLGASAVLASFFGDAAANVARRPHRYVEKLEEFESTAGMKAEEGVVKMPLEWWLSIPEVEIPPAGEMGSMAGREYAVKSDCDDAQISFLLLSCIEQAFHLPEGKKEDSAIIESFLVEVTEKLFYHQACFSKQKQFAVILNTFYSEMDDKSKYRNLGKLINRLCDWEMHNVPDSKKKIKKIDATSPSTLLEWFAVVRFNLTHSRNENFDIFSKKLFENFEPMDTETVNIHQQKTMFDQISQIVFFLSDIREIGKGLVFVSTDSIEWKYYSQAINWLSELLFRIIGNSKMAEIKNCDFERFLKSSVVQDLFLFDSLAFKSFTENTSSIVQLSSAVFAKPYMLKIYDIVWKDIAFGLHDDLCKLAAEMFDKFQENFSTDQLIKLIAEAQKCTDFSNLTDVVCKVLNICLQCLLKSGEDLYLKIETATIEYFLSIMTSEHSHFILSNLLQLLTAFPSYSLCADRNTVKWCMARNNNNEVRVILKNILVYNSNLHSYYIKKVCSLKTWKPSNSKFVVLPIKFLNSLSEVESKKISQKLKKYLTGVLDANTDSKEVALYKWMFEHKALTNYETVLLLSNTAEHFKLMEFIQQNCEILQAVLDYGNNEESLQQSNIVTILINTYIEVLKKEESNLDSILSLLSNLLSKDNFESALVENWEKIVKNSLKYKFTNRKVLDLLSSFIPAVCSDPTLQLHPDTVWMMITAHSHFLSTIFAMEEKDGHLKHSLVKLLHSVVVHCEKLNEKDLTFLFGAYNATLSHTDQYLYKILRVFESKGVSFSNQAPFLFGNTAIETYQSMKNAGETLFSKPTPDKFLGCLDRELMDSTLDDFPIRRRLLLLDTEKDWLTGESNVYDPSFILTALTSILCPENLIDARFLLKQGVLSFLFMCLSSHCRNVRNLSARCIHDFYTHAEGQWFSEKNLSLHSISCVRNAMTLDKNGDISKISSIIAVFLSTLNKLVFQPNDHMFFALHRYLLVKPCLDLYRVPDFYSLFFSAAMEYKTERAWILKLLVDGMKDMNDFHTMEKRQILRILMCFYSSPTSDNYTRKLVLKVIEGCCDIRGAVYNMINNGGVLAWLLGTLLQQREPSEDTKREDSTPHIVDIISQLWSTLNPENNVFFGDDAVKRNRVSVWMTKQIISLCYRALENTIDHSTTQDQSTSIEVCGKVVATLDSVITYTITQYPGTCLLNDTQSKLIYKVGKLLEPHRAEALKHCANVLLEWKGDHNKTSILGDEQVEIIAWTFGVLRDAAKLDQVVRWFQSWMDLLTQSKDITATLTPLRRSVILTFDALAKSGNTATDETVATINRMASLLSEGKAQEYSILKLHLEKRKIVD